MTAEDTENEFGNIEFELGSEGKAWAEEEVEEFIEAFEDSENVTVQDYKTKTLSFSVFGYDFLIRIRKEK